MVKGYKGFNQGLICNPNGKKFQFEEGKTYEEDKAIPCQTGFHYCKNPLDVLDFYPLIANDGTMNEFAEIEASEDITDDKIKFVSKKITIGAKLNIKGLINASVEFIKKETKISENVQASSGDRSQLASSGDRSQLASSGNGSKLASSGNYSKLASSGNYSQLASSGYGSQLASSGDRSQLASSGYGSQLASSGDRSQLASSGYGSQLASSGNYSKLASSGDCSQLASSGDGSQLASSGNGSKLALNGNNSVGANIGYGGQISGVIGSWITLAEYDENYCCKCVKSVKIDGVKLKENAMYELKNGKFVKV